MDVSVITIVKNAEKTIKKAIDSVVNQTYKSFEYIVIDGRSEDNSYNIICEYDSLFAQKNIPYSHFSENDNGIWDAMNKGIDIAQGEWIIFINADDSFYDSSVLMKVFGNKDKELNEYDVIYGNTNRILGGESFVGKANSIDTMRYNMPFCHQSSFTKANLLKEKHFDLRYRVADYAFFLPLYLNKGKYKQIDEIIANYSMEGFSNQNKYKTYLGTVQVRHDNGLINMYSWKQKVKNIYFKELLRDGGGLHGFVKWIDSKFSRRAI